MINKPVKGLVLVSVISLMLSKFGLVYAAECKPIVNKEVVEKSLLSRSASTLKEHLVTIAEEPPVFVTDHGKEGLKKVIDSLVTQLFDSHPIGNEKADDKQLDAIKLQLENGIVAACESLAAGDSDEEAEKVALTTSKLSDGDSQYYFLLGTANSLQGDGSFSSGLEASLYSTTLYPVRNMKVDSWKNSDKKVTGTVELTYSEIGEISESEDGGTDPEDPFSAGGGFFRFNGSLDPVYSKNNNTEGLGFRVGAGFSTQPSDSDSDVIAKDRVFLGVIFKANYGQDEVGRNGRGEIFIGYAYDKFWKYEETLDATEMTTRNVDEANRIVVDGRLDLPGVFKSENVRLHARLFADLPTSGDGPSDIRISVLLTVDIGSVFQIN